MTTTEKTSPNETVETLLRGYSCPLELFNQELHELLLVSHAKDSVAHFRKKYSDVFSGQLASFNRILGRLEKAEITAETAWDFGFGVVHESVVFDSEPEFVLKAAAQLLLWCHLGGFTGSWEINFQEPVQLRFGGWLLPEAKHLTVSAEERAIRIGGDLKVTLHRNDEGRWVSSTLTEFPSFGVDHRRIFLVCDPAALHRAADALELTTDPEGVAKMLAGCQESLELIQRFAPEYLEWVLRAIKYIYPMNETENAVASGSTRFHYSQIHLSYTRNRMPMVESLVHESAHQYYYIASRLGPVDDGSDETWYYSPPVDAQRQVGKILLAFHAFVNVIILTRRFKEGHFEEGNYVDQNEHLVGEMLDQLIKPLKGNAALTPIGRALAYPLIEYFA